MGERFAARFDGRQVYFELQPAGGDAHGLTPEFEADAPGGRYEMLDIDRLAEQPTLVNGSLQQGPPRVHHIPRLAACSIEPQSLLVSAPVKAVLERFELPPGTAFYPVTLKPKNLATTTPFFVMVAEEDLLRKALRYDKVTFFCAADILAGNHPLRRRVPLAEQPTGLDDIWPIERALRDAARGQARSFAGIHPDRHLLSATWDVMTQWDDGSRRWVVNEFVKRAIEQVCDGHVDFRSLQALNIEIDPAAYAAKAAAYGARSYAPAELHVVRSARARAALAKRDRLLASDPPLARPADEPRDGFADVEDTLNVRFPARFKRYHQRRFGSRRAAFRLLDPAEMHRIEPDYVARHPEAYKGVVVAQNGHGDDLALLLKADSDHLLGTTFYACLHESGRIERKRAIPKA